MMLALFNIRMKVVAKTSTKSKLTLFLKNSTLVEMRTDRRANKGSD